MRIAVLFRGCHYLPPNNPGKPWTVDVVDYRACIQNIYRMILDPLRNSGHEVDVYLGTYKSPIYDTLQDAFHPVQIITCDDPNIQAQLDMIIKALDALPVGHYDRIIVLRFDLKYKIPITEWDIPWGDNLTPCAWAAFREFASDDRNADTIFMLDGDESLQYMKDGLQLHTFPWDLHGLFNTMRGIGAHTDFIVKTGCYDSATFWRKASSKNPLYVMHGRGYYFDDMPE